MEFHRLKIDRHTPVAAEMDVQGEVLGWSFGIYECAQTKHFHRFYCTSVIFAASCCEPANQIPLNFISTSRMCSVFYLRAICAVSAHFAR
jgi:hypothetical protein